MIDSKIVGKYTLLLSTTEVGIGSLIHTFHLPLGGNLLSINQGIILTFATKKATSKREAISWINGISLMTALLKAYSPSGKKLTPMLAISVQGLLYSFGIFFLGLNTMGVMLSLFLLSFWAFLQSILIAYIIFGKTLFDAVIHFWESLCQSLSLSPTLGLHFLIGIVMIKTLLTLLCGLWAWSRNQSFETYYKEKMDQLEKNLPKPRPRAPSNKNPIRGALSDLLHPWFLLSLFLSISFLLLHGKNTYTHVWFQAFRILGGGFFLFLMLRILPVKWIQKWVPFEVSGLGIQESEKSH